MTAPWASRAAAALGGVVAVLGGCSTLLQIDDDDPLPASPEGSTEGRDSAADAADAAEPETEPLTGTDGAADDGAPIIEDASVDQYNPVGCEGDAACERVVFVTRDRVPFTTVANADTFCTNAAAATAALGRIRGRKFQAWTGNKTGADPASRFVRGTRPYIRPDGLPIAASWTDLTDGKLVRSIFHDETGQGAGAGERVWTAATVSGTFASPNCTEWTSGSTFANAGVVGALDPRWALDLSAQVKCSTSPLRLYCFEK